MLETFRNLGRITELAMVLVRNGFADLVERLELPFAKGTGARSGGEKLAQRYSTYARLRMVAEEMGPTFVKLGQLLSQRPDLLPKEMILEFRKLQDSVTPPGLRGYKKAGGGVPGPPLGGGLQPVRGKVPGQRLHGPGAPGGAGRQRPGSSGEGAQAGHRPHHPGGHGAHGLPGPFAGQGSGGPGPL